MKLAILLVPLAQSAPLLLDFGGNGGVGSNGLVGTIPFFGPIISGLAGTFLNGVNSVAPIFIGNQGRYQQNQPQPQYQNPNQQFGVQYQDPSQLFQQNYQQQQVQGQQQPGRN